MSWEFVGLAASLAIAAVLFWPYVHRDDTTAGRVPNAASQGASSPKQPTVPLEEDRAARSGGSATVEPGPAPEPEAPQQSETTLLSAPEKGAIEGIEKDSGQRKSDARSEQAEQEQRAAEAAADLRQDVAPGAPAVAPNLAAAPPSARSRSQVGQLEVSGGVPLRESTVEPGRVVQFDADEARRRLAAGRSGSVLDELGSLDPMTRIVLVGTRPGAADCAASRVVLGADGYEIRLARPGDGSADDSVHGCAFRLPRDGKPVRVVEENPR